MILLGDCRETLRTIPSDSGTVGMVAEEYGREWIGCELNEDYVKIAEKRTAQMGLLSCA